MKDYNSEQALFQMAELHWHRIQNGCRLTPESLLKTLRDIITRDVNYKIHGFSIFNFDKAKLTASSFLLKMEKERCVKKHIDYTKKFPIFIKTSNSKQRPKYRRFFDILNSLSLHHKFTSRDFFNEALKTMPNIKIQEVRRFLFAVSTSFYLEKEKIPTYSRGSSRLLYFKTFNVPENKMANVISFKNTKLKAKEKEIKTEDVTIIKNNLPSAYSVFETLEKQKEKIIKLKQENENLMFQLTKANQDCKNSAKREATARAQAIKYQEELNFIKRKAGFDKVTNLSAYQKDIV